MMVFELMFEIFGWILPRSAQISCIIKKQAHYFAGFAFLAALGLPVHADAPLFSRSEAGVTKSVVLYIENTEQDRDEMKSYFRKYFDQVVVLSTSDKASLEKDIAAFVGQINAQTMVTIYYSGSGYVAGGENWMLDDAQVAKLAQAPNPRHKPDKDGLSLLTQVVHPVAEQNPAGFVLFYNPEAIPGEGTAFAAQAIPNGAVFFPNEDNEFIDITDQVLSHQLPRWAEAAAFKGAFYDGLDYDKYQSYCLMPTVSGCEGDVLPVRDSAALPESVTEATVEVEPVAEVEKAEAVVPTDTINDKTAETEASNCTEFSVDYREEELAVAALTISSACRAGQIATVDYEGYEYTAKLDESGQAVIRVFLIKPESEAVVRFEDGAKTVEKFSTTALAVIDRVVLSWRGQVQLDLHATAFRVALNSAEDVWRETACAPDFVSPNGMHLACVEGVGADAMHLQVFTRERDNANQAKGIIDLYVDYYSRGSKPASPYCDAEEFASVDFQSQLVMAGEIKRSRKLIFSSVPCGIEMSDKVRYLKGAVDNIRVK